MCFQITQRLIECDRIFVSSRLGKISHGSCRSHGMSGGTDAYVNLSKQARAIEATLGDITPFNAGKKKEEALSMLKKWFPQMENFSGQLKKYKVTINDLLAENEKLEARAKAGEKCKMKDTIYKTLN